jgi:hypothetical protein
MVPSSMLTDDKRGNALLRTTRSSLKPRERERELDKATTTPTVSTIDYLHGPLFAFTVELGPVSGWSGIEGGRRL